MNARQLRLIAIALAVLLALWGASEYLTRGSDTTTGTLRFPGLSAATVDSIAIIHGTDTIQFAKQTAGAWTVNHLPASASAVADLLKAFADSTPPPELAAQSASSFTRMGVDSAGGRLVRVAGGGKTLMQVFVGARGPSYDAVYVRVPGDTKVYLWPGSLAIVAERALDDWREKQIAAVPPESIAAVELVHGAKTHSLHKAGAAWVFGPPSTPADSAAVARYLEHFRHVSAAGFATAHQVDSLRSSRPVRRITLRGTGGRELLALSFDSVATGFWVRREGDPIVYRLDFWQADQLTPTAQGLTKKK